MALRLMQIFLPDDQSEAVNRILKDREVLSCWKDSDSSRTVLHLLVPAEETEPIMDEFEQQYGDLKGFHVVLSPVEAVLPRPQVAEEAEQAVASGKEANGQRISREELYVHANEGIGIDRIFLGLTMLSAIVAAVGLLRDDVAVIIGAMVIAPLLGPNVAGALATTLGDMKLLRRAALTNLTGVLLAFAFAVIVGSLFPVNPEVPSIADRTSTGFGDVLLALAAGTAGTLAFTSGQAGAVIGVMVAVALVPPVVVCGMLLGAGYVSLSFNAFQLAAANIICINLSGVVTFLLQGVRPRNWSEAEVAKKAVRAAVLTWLILLSVLLVVLWFSRLKPDR